MKGFLLPMLFTNNDFNRVLNMSKYFIEPKIILPTNGQKKIFELENNSCNEQFFIDIDRRGRFELTKSKTQMRYEKGLILVRLEVDAPPHMNPNGTKTGRNHIHIYKEGYDLKWAYDIDDFDHTLFKNSNNFNILFNDFCVYCNIETKNISCQGVI